MKSIVPVIAIFFLAAACIATPAAAEIYFGASTPQVITKGDEFSVSGTGAANGTISLWVIGREHFEVRSVTPDRHGNYSIVFKTTDTAKFMPGQYAVVLQDPGTSGTIEIEPGRDSEGNITIMNRGKIIARLGAVENLRGNVQPETASLLAAARLQGVDDTFSSEYFFVEEPAIDFEGIIPASGSHLPDRISGERILITGTTNLRTDDTLLAEIRHNVSRTPVTTKDLTIIPGSSLNRWSYVLEEPGLEPGEYFITVSLPKTTINTTARFTVVPDAAGDIPPPAEPLPRQTGEVPLPRGLDTLLILGIVFVSAVVVYTIGKR